MEEKMMKSAWLRLLLCLSLLLCIALSFASCDCKHKKTVAAEENLIKAVCGSGGSYDLVVYCEKCGVELSRESKSIDALGEHTPGEWVVDTEPTLTSDGTKHRDCTTCGARIESGKIPALSHIPSDWIADPPATCISVGSRYKECTVCHAELEREDIPQLTAHTPGESVMEHYSEASCTVNGGYDHVVYCCVPGCGAEVSRAYNTIVAPGHSYKDGACTECGAIKPANGLEFTSNGDGTCYVSGIGTCTDTAIVIPDRSPGGELVVGIGGSAFYGCSSVTSVTIPPSVKSIGVYAFSGTGAMVEDGGVYYVDKWAVSCSTAVTTVSIRPDTVGISDDSFSSRTALADITIPGSVKFIGNKAFYGCTGIEDVVINSGVETIGNSAFYGCGNMTCVIIPDTVKSIGDNAFSYCMGLLSAIVGDGVETIGAYAFYYCTALESVNIGKSVKSMGGYVFGYCNMLDYVYFNAVNMDDLNWDSHIFNSSGKSGYGISVVIGKDVAVIPAYLFDNNYGYYSHKVIGIMFEGGGVCTKIGDYAFNGCDKLDSVSIPDSVTIIGAHSFGGCNGLESVEFADPTGWKAGSTVILSADLEDGATAATYLKSTYDTSEWVKES